MNRRKILPFLSWLAATFIFIVSCAPTPEVSAPAAPTEPVTLTISAAASLTDALQAIQPIYQETAPEVNLTFNFGSSGSLQQQIEQGAPVDVFLSAAARQMDELESQGLILSETRHNLVGNEVVLIAPTDETAIASFEDLEMDSVERVAIGDPESVPAGKYAQDVLTSLNVLEAIEPKLVLAKDVRQVLTYVETGNVDAGVVYRTDAQISDRIKVITTAPAESHAPVIYPIAVLQNSQNADAATEFVQFLLSEPAQTVFQEYGFKPAA
jgi:molybdate transport system substrate-binding protein